MLTHPLLGNFLPAAWYTSQKRIRFLAFRQQSNRASSFFTRRSDRICRPTRTFPLRRGPLIALGYTFALTLRQPSHEIEVKLAVANLLSLVDRIRRIGAACIGRVFEQNIIFDTPDSDFRSAGCLLRLRIETPAKSEFAAAGRGYQVLTSKAPVLPPSGKKDHPRGQSKYKDRLETELVVAPSQNWPRVLVALGFVPSFRYEKYRTSFRSQGIHLDLDETPAGTFLELEGSPASIDRTARRLGYSSRDYLQLTYWELYAADCRRRGVKPGNMVFDT
jgi:adenylate cyclase class 2